jgi:arsenate reductase
VQEAESRVTPPDDERPDILFLCVANSARSQLAEGLARRLAPAHLQIYSAGSEPGTLNPYAVTVMAEVDIDLSGHFSKSVDDVPLDRIGTVITLCAEEVCPVLPGPVRRLHWPFPDPANRVGSEQELLAEFRSARNAIELALRAFFDEGA